MPFPQIKTKYKRTSNSFFARDESMPLASRSPTPMPQSNTQMDTRSQSIMSETIVKPETVSTEPISQTPHEPHPPAKLDQRIARPPPSKPKSIIKKPASIRQNDDSHVNIESTICPQQD